MPILFQKQSQYWPPHVKGIVLWPIYLQFQVIPQVGCLAVLGIIDRHWVCALITNISKLWRIISGHMSSQNAL